ncbi:MAG: hypothetical protein ACRCVX_15905 [Shewanella sp.]
MKAIGSVVRMCGTARTEGGVYLESGMSDDPMAKPLEWFLVDPPKPYEPDCKLGVEMVEGADGKTHVIDYVGLEHYPYATDFLEEVRRFGLSRKVSKNIDFSRLSHGSKIIIVHARGLIAQSDLNRVMPPDYTTPLIDQLVTKLDRLDPTQCHCGHHERTGSLEHLTLDYSGWCSRHLWAFTPADEAIRMGNETLYYRQCPSFKYQVFPVDPSASDPLFQTATIAVFPITNISVVKSRDGSHQATFDHVKKQLKGIPVGLENV